MLTPQEIETRRSYWTASDTVRAMTAGRGGLIEVAARKRWPMEWTPPTPDQEEGNRLESHVGSWALATLGIDGADAQYQPWRTLAGTRLGATLDYLLPDNRPLEVKTTGILGGSFAPGFNEWGEDGSGDVPAYVWWQVQHQMVVVGSKSALVAALIAGKGHRLYEIPAYDGIGDRIVRMAGAFWRKYVDVPFDSPLPEIGLDEANAVNEILKSVKREPKKRIFAPQLAKPFADWDRLNESALVVDKAATAAKDRIVFGLGDAEEADLGDGRLLTYIKGEERRFRQTEFKNAHPGLYAEYTLPGPKQSPLRVTEIDTDGIPSAKSKRRNNGQQRPK